MGPISDDLLFGESRGPLGTLLKPLRPAEMPVARLLTRPPGSPGRILELRMRPNARVGKPDLPLAGKPDVDLARDVAPLVGLAKASHQFLEVSAVPGGVLEPGQEIEWLAEVAAVMQAARHRG